MRHHPAKLLTLSARVIEHIKDAVLVRFRIDQPLHRDDPEFGNMAAFNLRLLREAVGDAHLFLADMSDEDFASLQHVDWELLPPGSGTRVLARLASGRGVSPDRLKVAEERLRLIDRLGHDD